MRRREFVAAIGGAVAWPLVARAQRRRVPRLPGRGAATRVAPRQAGRRARDGNLPAHEAPRVRALLDRSGFAYRYLPAYSPDLNPIEPAWAKVKAELRRVAARTVDALHGACGPALAAITPQDAAGFFRHSGYGRPG
jgi:hypothetical protein